MERAPGGPRLAVAVLALAGALAAAVAIAWPLLPTAADITYALGQLVLQGVLMVMAWMARGRLRGRLRGAWTAISISAALGFGALIAAIAFFATGLPVHPGAVAIVFALVNIGLLVGLVMMAPPNVEGRSAVRFGMDGLIAAGALFFLFWAMLDLGEPGGRSPPPTVALWAVAYPAVDAAGLAVLLLVAGHAGGAAPRWLRAVGLACGLVFIADSIGSILELRGVGWAVPISNGGFLLGLGLLARGAAFATEWPPRPARQPHFAGQWGVYALFGLVLLSAVYDYVENGAMDAIRFAAVSATGLLVIVRTVMLLLENAALQRRLQQLDAYKMDLLRFISHEMANPLSPLRLQLHLAKPAPGADHRGWDIMQRSVDRLESLSRDVRVMALAESGRLIQTLVPVDVVAHARAAAASADQIASARKITLRTDFPERAIKVPMDPQRFGQVLDNLLSNAFKFTPEGGTVTLRVEPSPDDVRVVVEDTGIGLTPDERGRLFQAFQRLHEERAGGLGLGLYLSRAIMQAHGGAIGVDSDGKGKGSRFWAVLPRHAAVADPTQAFASASPAALRQLP